MAADAQSVPLPSFATTIDSEPFDFYDRLRKGGGVRWDEQMGTWLVSSYEACKFVARNDERLFRHAYLDDESGTYVELQGGPRNLLFLEHENHLGLHRLLMRTLSPGVCQKWRPTIIRPAVNELIDRFIGRGRVELVGELCEKLPVRVITATMGLPWHDEAWVDARKSEMDSISTFVDAHDQRDEGIIRRGLEASSCLNEVLMPVIRERKNSDGEDLISMLWREGPRVLDGWDESDVQANVRVLFLGGTDTTAKVMSSALYTLLTEPSYIDILRYGSSDSIAAFAEEMLRLYGTLHLRPRKANQDVEVEGVLIHKDDPVLTLNIAANRDSGKYGCPHSIDLSRESPRDHMTFHLGPRMCVGASLARVELQETIGAVVERLADLRPDPRAEPPRFRGFGLRSWRPLHALFTPTESLG